MQHVIFIMLCFGCSLSAILLFSHSPRWSFDPWSSLFCSTSHNLFVSPFMVPCLKKKVVSHIVCPLNHVWMHAYTWACGGPKATCRSCFFPSALLDLVGGKFLPPLEPSCQLLWSFTAWYLPSHVNLHMYKNESLGSSCERKHGTAFLSLNYFA